MKKTILALALAVSMSAFAVDGNTGLQMLTSLSNNQQQQQQQSSISAAQNAGNAQTVNYITPAQPATTTTNVNYSGDYTIKNVPSVNGPNLITSNDTCMGSTSGSLNFAGIGIGGGST